MKPRVKGGRPLWITGGRLPGVTHFQVHARNAAAMWEALSKGHGALLVGTEEVRIVAPSPYHALRAIVLDPDTNRPTTIAAILDAMMAEAGRQRRVVEDASGALDLSGHGFAARFRLTVMVREPEPVTVEPPSSAVGPPFPTVEPLSPAVEPDVHAGPPGTGGPPGTKADICSVSGGSDVDVGNPEVHVAPVQEPRKLLVAESILTAVFPPSGPAPDLQGRIQPRRVLDIPGWRVWLGYRDDVPAGAVYTFHDGTSLGVYQLATLPEHRGHGVARALMAAILRAYPTDIITLSATDQGRPLYTKLGFTVSSTAIWWQPSHTGDDSGGVLR